MTSPAFRFALPQAEATRLIASVAPLAERYPQLRETLLKAWREREGIAPQ